MDNLSDIQAKLVIDDITAESRNYARSLFIGMAQSDGYVHPKESAIINHIFK